MRNRNLLFFLGIIATFNNSVALDLASSEKRQDLLKNFAVGYVAGLIPGVGQCEVLSQAIPYVLSNDDDDKLLSLWCGHGLGFATYLFSICSLAKNHGPWHATVAGMVLPVPAFLFLKQFGMLARAKEYKNNNKLISNFNKIKQYFSN